MFPLPWGGLVIDSSGNIYGTTLSGGSNFLGTVFQLSPGSNGTWSEKVLYNFSGGADGGSLFDSSLTIDANGNLYGAAENGGAYGYGVVFEIVAGSHGILTGKILQ